MRLDRNQSLHVFDTSALIAFSLGTSPGHAALVARLPPAGLLLYHPVTLSEITEHIHPQLIAERQPGLPAHEVARYVAIRRRLFGALCAHRKRDDPSTYVQGHRFLPFVPPPEWFVTLANERSLPANLRRMRDGRPTAVAPMTDHQILAVAAWLHRYRFPVTFVSGDQDQLAAAAHLGVAWIYSHDPARTAPFPWVPL